MEWCPIIGRPIIRATGSSLNRERSLTPTPSGLPWRTETPTHHKSQHWSGKRINNNKTMWIVDKAPLKISPWKKEKNKKNMRRRPRLWLWWLLGNHPLPVLFKNIVSFKKQMGWVHTLQMMLLLLQWILYFCVLPTAVFNHSCLLALVYFISFQLVTAVSLRRPLLLQGLDGVFDMCFLSHKLLEISSFLQLCINLSPGALWVI